MTKQEKIKEAWGNQCFDKINKDGWLYFGYCVNGWDDIEDWLDENNLISDENYYDMTCKELDNGDLILVQVRPKSLQGIENNNGWIKIEEEDLILPIDGTEVHFYHSFVNENGIQNEYHKGIFNAALGFTSFYDSENYKVKEVTHYQPIEKPKPPLY